MPARSSRGCGFAAHVPPWVWWRKCRTGAGASWSWPCSSRAPRRPLVGWPCSGLTRRSPMPRTIWSGAISFGLVTVPIHVQSATENHSIQFHQYHLEDMGRVRVKKVCEIEDREIQQSEIGKGYEYAKDQVVAISDEELRELPLPTAKAIEIQAFVPPDPTDPIQIGEGYYLAADGAVAAKPYKLLVQALGRSSKVAVAKYAWSGRERLGLLRIRDDAIGLPAMRWPDDV